METVVLTGAAGPTAEAVVARLATRRPDARLHVLAPRPLAGPGGAGSARVTAQVLDLPRADLRAELRSLGPTAVVHLGMPVDGVDPYQLAPGRAVDEAHAVLAAAAAVGVPSLTVVSSALVCGALAAHPVPLTEDAVVHPDAAYRPAVELAEIERVVGTWRDDQQDVAVTVLRCAPVVADGAPGWLATELHRALAYPVEGHDPPMQYLHADDLADAIDVVLGRPAGGVVHVAPDGWLAGPERRELETRPRVSVPAPAARVASAVRGAWRGSGGPEGIRAYVTHHWVVANDRLRASGWAPSHANDEAYVAAFRAAPWSMVGSARRQELAIGAVLAALAGGVGAVAALAARRRHR
jgi:UDP-glucose 4-epimerase